MKSAKRKNTYQIAMLFIILYIGVLYMMLIHIV